MKRSYRFLLATTILSSLLLLYASFLRLRATEKHLITLKSFGKTRGPRANETVQTLHRIRPDEIRDKKHETVASLKSHEAYDEEHLDLFNETFVVPHLNEGEHDQKPPTYRKLTIDYKRPRHVLWRQDVNCSRIDVRFGTNISGAFLHSFPRSGNTWLRYLLEAATGIFTSSFYTDRTLIRQGYLGERDKFWEKTTIATKLHFIKHLKLSLKAPCITIIRNPARLFVSLWSYVNVQNRRLKHTAVIPENTLNSTEFHTFIQGKLKKWLKTYIFALTIRKTIFPVSYELIREDPIGQIRRLLAFLNIKPDENRLACLAKHTTGKVKAGQRSIKPYTSEEEKQMEAALEKINEYLTKRGLQPMPDYDKYS
ncbi:sialate:O-sulfotransferase 1-like [Macrobrachium rosenbergii]|uniref:sialate:O-sulfotransferase 1-like n=1 Tax=Macrobrachium rosenbergii TaxID=79674 RepID=UPI0034D56858